MHKIKYIIMFEVMITHYNSNIRKHVYNDKYSTRCNAMVMVRSE